MSTPHGAQRIRVGIIGANPDRGWAAQAHIPALTSLSDDFEITALSTTRRESADAASKLFGVPAAFDNHQELVNSPAVDVVAVTVKVPYHLELATAAIGAGKAVYCEWPLGNGLKEAETLAVVARNQGVLAVAGLQARSAPSVAFVRELIAQGYVGEVLSTTLIGSGMGWGPTVEPFNAYLNDKKNGATMLSIAVGHAADALCHCLGEARELSATMTLRRKTFTIPETGESKPRPRLIRCASADCSRAARCSRFTIAAGPRAARTCSGRSTAARAICSSLRQVARPRFGRWTSAGVRARSPRSNACPFRGNTDGRHRRALPPTSPRRTRISPATIARERTSAPPLRTLSRAIACSTRSKQPRQQVSVKRWVDPRLGRLLRALGHELDHAVNSHQRALGIGMAASGDVT